MSQSPEELKKQFGAAGVLHDVKCAYNRLAELEEAHQQMLQDVRECLELAIEVIVLYDEEEQAQKDQAKQNEEPKTTYLLSKEELEKIPIVEIFSDSDSDPANEVVGLEPLNEHEEEEEEEENSLAEGIELYEHEEDGSECLGIVEFTEEEMKQLVDEHEEIPEEEEEEEEKPEPKHRKKTESLPFSCLNEVDKNRKTYMAYRHQYYKIQNLFEKIAENPDLEDSVHRIKKLLKKDAPTVRKLKEFFQKAFDLWQQIKSKAKPRPTVFKINKAFYSMKAILDEI